MMRPRMFRFLILLVLTAAACRSATTSYDYPEDLLNPNYVKRSLAVREFAETKDESQLPQAFHLLLDDESHIRAMAWSAIREMVPESGDLGYSPILDENDRLLVVARMKAAWENSHGGTPGG